MDDFVNLMDVDLRERYLEARTQKEDVEDIPIEEKIVREFLYVLRQFQKRIVHFEKRDEVEITADLQDAVGGILNNKYGVHVARGFTMGRARKKLGETEGQIAGMIFQTRSRGCIYDWQREWSVIKNELCYPLCFLVLYYRLNRRNI